MKRTFQKSLIQVRTLYEVSPSANNFVEKASGKGGRSSNSGIVATVFGATGQLGRYVVNHLGRCGSQVVVPYRGDDNSYRHLKVMGDLGQIVPLKWDPRNLKSVERAVSHSNVVINLIGAQVPTSNFSLDDANRKIARLVARVSKERNVDQYVHVSDLRADLHSPSEYARIKAQAETEVLELFPEATIVRPAPLFGPEDKLTNAYGILLRYWKNMVPMIAGDYELSPIYAGDAGAGIMRLVQEGGPSVRGKIVEMVGPERFSQRELCEAVANLTEQSGNYTAWPIPPKMVEPFLPFLSRMPRLRPYFTYEEIRMRQGRSAVPSGDANVVYVDKGTERIETSGLLWLRRFREVVSMNQVVGDKHKYDTFFKQ